EELKSVWKTFAQDILGLKLEAESENSNLQAYQAAVDLLLDIRLKAKQNKDWATSDEIRNKLTEIGFSIKDTKEGFEWSI
ncbi:MAG: cysteine--tRNA ligase, partial [Paludibacteraceae bacterium]|nr:cysteine--tRNA ligase [Paludibacteraceae bacterium]